MGVQEEVRATATSREPTVEDALWSLYDEAGEVPAAAKRVARFQRLSLEESLSMLARATPQQVSVASKQATLAALARANDGELPRYQEFRDVYEAYLRTLGEEPRTKLRFGDTDVALGDQVEALMAAADRLADTCDIQDVVVEGHEAVWVFSEIETDQSFESLTFWVNPDNWLRWGPILFKDMHPVGGLVTVTQGSEQTHGTYMEVVSLLGRKLFTELRCDVKYTADWAGMTYDLGRSIGNDLTVDRGFL